VKETTLSVDRSASPNRTKPYDRVLRRGRHQPGRRASVFQVCQRPSIGKGNPDPHARQERQASSVSRPLEGQQRRKSPVRRCFKSRSSVETEFAGSLRLPVCFSGGSPASCPGSRQPTHDHRHVRFGQGHTYEFATRTQEKNAQKTRPGSFFRRPGIWRRSSPIFDEKCRVTLSHTHYTVLPASHNHRKSHPRLAATCRRHKTPLTA